MAKTFKDKIAFITGGASGIGRETVFAFSGQGAKVAICDINEKNGTEVAEQVNSRNGHAIFIKMNAANPVDVETAITKTIQHFGKLDFAINNAGVGGAHSATHLYPEKNWVVYRKR